MARLLGNLSTTLLLSVALLLVVAYGFHGPLFGDGVGYANGVFRYLHVLCGIMWIGLLYYFNFVQIPTMPRVPAEMKPGVSKYIAPEALFWFRWAALFTVLTGLIVAMLSGYLVDALLLRSPFRLIGLGMWLALVMAFNVWFLIWPNQKKALGLVEADAETKARAATTAMLVSRTNTLLSLPMLYCMVTQGLLGGG
ncbi:urate hydroxylase PuuD [Sandaracinobacter sp. RS1-74]|uniref:urate hydroxylase PuuD n=1 Tax=Sandaracinobacteroides sayramensis TaxID=2913411 RepID=UPI001ED9ECA7|nr:urate hydroxylase PuuD [Sandaracinobacteroides sayramensis]MCG2841891.1 urate hydroxylase PuuD [Sandaracinobacteroides sayramensis]